MYPDSEILFPSRCIPELRNLRPGAAWRQLIDRLCKLPESHEDVLAFSFMMIKLNNCLTCDLDSYRASLGCCQCARRTVQGFKGNDTALIAKMEEARKELRAAYASRRDADGRLAPAASPQARSRHGNHRPRARNPRQKA